MTGEVVSYSGPGPGSNGHQETKSLLGDENGSPSGRSIQSSNNRSLPSSPIRELGGHLPFQTHVDWHLISRTAGSRPTSPTPRASLASLGARSRKAQQSGTKSADDVQRIVESGKVRELKSCLRLQHWMPYDSARSKLWNVISSYHIKDKATMDSLYWDTVTQIYGTLELVPKAGPLPTFVEPSFQMSYYLNDTGIQVARRVVTIISYSCPDITYAPSLYPITCLLLHYMNEEDAYICISMMVASKKVKFITQTKLHYETIWRTAMILCRRHAKSAVSYIIKQFGENANIEAMHQQWLTCIFKELPFQHLVRVIDCFIFEGRKIMYRVWMAILILFSRHLASFSPSARASLNKEGSVESALLSFCRNLPHGPDKLLRTAYGIRNFRSIEMDRLFIKTEMYLKSKTTTNASMPNSNSHHKTLGPRSRSSDVLPSSQSQINIQMVSHTLTIQEGCSSPGVRTRSLGLYPIQALRSVACDYDSLLTLWSWLPVRITMYQPELLYTTEEHGCSMTTFFNRCEQHEPTILIVKTATGEVFGAYCSNRWADRKSKDSHGGRQGYFGTGESFVFTMMPQMVKYPWVGISAAQQTTADGQQAVCVRHAAELFMASDGHMITIGGGKGQAIWIDENIRNGKTEASLTFNNPPLSSTQDFEIRVLEVYGFQGLS